MTAPPSPALDDTVESDAEKHERGRGARGLMPVSSDLYLLGEEIARGGMGRIRAGRDRRLDRAVAVKEVLVPSEATVQRFEREARITARLQHPSIVNVYEAGVWPSGEPFYAMKLVTGRSLDEVIAETKTLDDRLALLPNVLAIADAMAYAHGEQVVHRDLKPKNVLVGVFGENVVIDWGLAKDLAASGSEIEPGGADGDETRDGAVLGTPAYMPPEQAAGGAVTMTADVYAIGAILYHVLSGKPPYTGASSDDVLQSVKHGAPPPLGEEVPSELRAIVDHAMARDPRARYATARGLARDLRSYTTGKLVGAHQYSRRDLAQRWFRRNRAASLLGLLAVVLLVVGALAVRQMGRAERMAEEASARAETQRIAAEHARDDAERGLRTVMLRAVFGTQDPGIRSEEFGNMNRHDGAIRDALHYYRLALVSREQVAKAGGPAWQRLVAHSHDLVGDTLAEIGDLAGAQAEWKAGLAILQGLDRNAAPDPSGNNDEASLAAKIQMIGFVQRN